MIHLIDEEWLKESWKRVFKGSAAGIDHVNARMYEENLEGNIQALLAKLKNGTYRASPVRRVYIPKADGRERPLGIPIVEDKLVQRAVGLLLSAIYEQDFLPMSYGFRQGRNAHQAIDGMRTAITTQSVGWVLDVDISSFFDEISHEHLMKFLRHRIGDEAILALIQKWLKAGVMEEGKLKKTSSGAPQGGVISPILANVYLHYVIDLWVTRVIPKYLKGKMQSFRYADDVLFCFQYRNDAVRFMKALKQRLAKFGLRLNESKTKLCRFGRFAEENRRNAGEHRATFQFLGFTFYNGKTQNGKYTVGVKTASKRLHGCMQRVTEWCKTNRHVPVSGQSKYLNSILEGHYLYYGITGNFPQIKVFYRHTLRVWHRYLCRRSQRASIRWEKFLEIQKRYPVKRPYLPKSIFRRQSQPSFL